MNEMKRENIKDLQSLDFIWLEVTGKCNLECVHCYADSSPYIPMKQGMGHEDWKNVLRDGYEAGCRKVQFIGGEPTLLPNLIDLLNYARSLGYSYLEIYTNGTHFTKELKNAFLTNNVKLAFSYYSSDSLIHDKVTTKKGSQEKTGRNIEWAINAGLDVRVSIIDLGFNTSTINETKKTLTDMGVKKIGIDRVREVGRGERTIKTNSQMDELCGKCWQGKLCVTPTGEIFPCVFSRFYSLGNAKDGIANALSTNRLFSFRSSQRLAELKKSELSGNTVVNSDCSPDWTCAPDFGHDCEPDDPDHECSPYTGGCNPKE